MTATSAPVMTRRPQQFSAAWAAGDLHALMSYMTDDCVYHASVGPEPGSTPPSSLTLKREGGVHCGLREVRLVLARALCRKGHVEGDR